MEKNQFRSEMKTDGTLSVSYKGYDFDFDMGFEKEKVKVPKKDKNGKEIKWPDRRNLRSYLYDHYEEICVYPTQTLVDSKEVKTYFSKLTRTQEAGENAFLDYYNKNRVMLISIFALYIIIGLVLCMTDELSGGMSLFIILFVFFSFLMIGVSLFYYFHNQTLKNHEYYSCKVFIYDCFYHYDENGVKNGVRVRVWDGEKYLINQWYEMGTDLSMKHGTEVTMYVCDTKNKHKILIKKED